MRLIFFLLPFLTLGYALQANLAGVVDWHKPLLGIPLLEPSPPSIVETSAGRRVVLITKENIFGTLDPEGQIVWRQQLAENDPVVSYHVNGDNALLLSGPSATTARLFSLITGHVIWEQELLEPSHAILTTPIHLGTDAAFAGDSLVVLSDGRRVSKLDLQTGEILFSLDAPGASSTFLFKQLYVSGQSIHILALTSSFASQTLTTLSLSLETSAPLNDLTQIPSFISAPSDAVLAAGFSDGEAQIVWFEHGRIRTALLQADGTLGTTKDLLPGKGKKYARILPSGSRQYGFILGQKEDGSVDIIDVRKGAIIVETFESSTDHADRSTSVYSTVKSKNGVVFNRVYWSFNMGMAACQTYIISTTEREIINSGFTFGFDTTSHGVLLSAAPSSKVNNAQLVTILVTTSSGSVQMIQNDRTLWTREESLSEIQAVKFIDLGEPAVEEADHVLDGEGYFGRLARHIYGLRLLPAYWIRFVERLVGSYASTVATKPLSFDNLHRDQFGFQKLLVAVTKSGKVFALDSADGNIVWSTNLGLLDAQGAEIEVLDMFTVRELGEAGSPTVAVIAVRDDTTVGFHIDAFTGQVSGERLFTGLPKGKELFRGRPEATFLLPYENCGTKLRVLGLVAPSSRLHLFPFCKKIAGERAAASDKQFFTSLEPSLVGPILKGMSPVPGPDHTFTTASHWAKAFGPGQVDHTTPVTYEAIASFGRVRGDKSTLYKYLNPHLLVATSYHPSSQSGLVSVLDSTSGQVIYEVHVADLDTSRGILAAMVENLLVYRWKDSKGWRIASVELYEDPHGKPQTPGLSSFASGHNVTAFTQTFVLTEEIKSMSFTSSRAGIAVKDLVYANGDNQISLIPRRLLDPRRPIGKPTSSDKEELLIPYDPLLAPEPKRVISHGYQVLGVKALTSSPALLESSSLLFAHGLDLFLTRGINPSGTFDILSDGFNKVQLLLTLAGLTAGILVAKPAVQRRILKAKWY